MMLKSQLQTTNFSKNFLYELPDEMLEMIYRQMFGDVVRQLDKMIMGVGANDGRFLCYIDDIHKHQPYLLADTILKFKKNVKVSNMLNKMRRKTNEIVMEDVEKRIQSGYSYGYSYGYYDFCYISTRLPFKMVYYDGFGNGYWSVLTKYDKKEDLMKMLQQSNKEVYKSWTKQKMIKALMSF